MSSENKNLFLAVLLSMLVLFGWNYFVEAPKQEELQKVQLERAKKLKAQKDVNDVIEEIAPIVNRKSVNSSVKNKKPVGEINPIVETPIATDNFSGVISSKGLIFKELKLNNYKQSVEKGSPLVDIMKKGKSLFKINYTSNNPKLNLPDENTTWKLVTSGIRASVIRLTVDSPLVYTWNNGQGLSFKRTISVDKNYLFTIVDNVVNNGSSKASLSQAVSVDRSFEKEPTTFAVLHEGPLGFFGNKLVEISYEDLKEKKVINFEDSAQWFGVTDKYWQNVIIPSKDDQELTQFSYEGVTNKLVKYKTSLVGKNHVLAKGESIKIEHHLFSGPKKIQLLDRYEEQLHIKHFDKAVDFGWLYIITKPMFYVLEYLYNTFGSFAIALILLTILVKLLMLPIAIKSSKSMARMREVKPLIDEINERYADDKTKQQEELMALYKKEKINPASGCLPLFLQIPVFFALYKVLYISIDMRHAPFWGWIRDLSAPDPTNIFNLFGLLPFDPPSFLMIGIWPIIMGVTMYIQQKLTPTPGTDKAQQTMFLMMPIIFVFISGGFPVGLVIYWTVSNVLTIAQQYIINNMVHKEKAVH